MLVAEEDVGGNISSKRPACAACRFQRRRCTAECLLGPFFPADRQEEFRNVHRLFGVRNMINIVKRVPAEKIADTVNSIIYEANARDINPVQGCVPWIHILRHRINRLEAELDHVLRQIELCKKAITEARVEDELGKGNANRCFDQYIGKSNDSISLKENHTEICDDMFSFLWEDKSVDL